MIRLFRFHQTNLHDRLHKLTEFWGYFGTFLTTVNSQGLTLSIDEIEFEMNLVKEIVLAIGANICNPKEMWRFKLPPTSVSAGPANFKVRIKSIGVNGVTVNE